MKKFLLYIFALAAMSVLPLAATSCDDPVEEAKEYSVTATAGEGGSVETLVAGAAASKAFEGDDVTLTATPDEGYEFVKWTVVSGGVQLTDTPATFTMPAEDVSVKAEFKAKESEEPELFTIAVTDDGNGTAEASVEGNPVDEAEEGTEISLTATADEGYVFVRWTAESGNVVFSDDRTDNPATFIMPAGNVSIKAEFEEDEVEDPTFTIDMTNDGCGESKATIAGAPASNAHEGTKVTITAIPDEGYLFDKWTTDNDDIEFDDPQAEVAIFTMPAENVVIRAEFRYPELYEITITSDGNGRGVASYHDMPAARAHAESTIKLTAIPDDGYVFGRWTTESEGVVFDDAEASTTTFTMPAAAVEIGVEFVALEEEEDIFTKIVDPAFKTYCEQFDKNRDGILSTSEAYAVKSINAPSLGITTLIGIEHFKNLEKLAFEANQVVAIDVTKNTALTHLYCTLNSLVSLKVAGNTSLILLYCGHNRLATLDVSGCTSLTDLMCDMNKMTSLNMSGCTVLEDLNCQQNLLTSIDVSEFSNMTELVCWGNRIAAVDATNMTTFKGGTHIEGSYDLVCGDQLSADGTTPLTCMLTLREDQKDFWYSSNLVTHSHNTNVQIVD